MAENFKLTIEYDGGAYHGRQRQKEDRTIQFEIEKAIKTVTGESVALIGSGRTDAGVHALAQVANFSCSTGLSSRDIHRALNSLTPVDIVIRKCEKVDENFHARYDAKSKIYIYRILNSKIPIAVGRQYSWLIKNELDVDSMRKALNHVRGSHDFKAFEGTGSPRPHTVRHVMKAEIDFHDKGILVFEIEADGFLRYMVRNITGSLVDVGLSKISPEEFERILLSKDRNLAGPTAPPQGLFLKLVNY